MALESYTKTVWKSGDIVTATKFNNIENQISNLTKVFIPDNSADRMVASKSDWGLIKIANNDNYTIENGILNFNASPTFTTIHATNIETTNISASGDATIGNTLTVTNKFSIGANAIILQNPTTINSTLTVSGIVSLNGELNGVNATLSGTLGVTGQTTLGAVTANNISITNGLSAGSATITNTITAGKVTLSSFSSETTYANADLVPYGKLTDYVTSTITSTVPAWAREATKPTYTATEVGASAAGAYFKPAGGIPISDLATNDISAFNNDAEYLSKPGEAGDYYLSVHIQEGTNTLTSAWANLPLYPDPPTTDGIYKLQVTVTDGTPIYGWVSENGGE